jgi:hypothetical protein
MTAQHFNAGHRPGMCDERCEDMIARQAEQYRQDYNRGWRYSHSPTANLDHLDDTGASNAVYDGYLDYAAGREKWATPDAQQIRHERNLRFPRNGVQS